MNETRKEALSALLSMVIALSLGVMTGLGWSL